MILLVDSLDSFTFNLAALLRTSAPGRELRVCRVNDEQGLEEFWPHASLLVLSPGPGRPVSEGTLCGLVRRALGRIPILGVCLGHQAIAVALGGALRVLDAPVHGKVHALRHDGVGEYAGVGAMQATRYHSLVVEEASLPAELEVSARDARGDILSFRHRAGYCVGWQFHPESVASDSGSLLVRNALYMMRGERKR